MASDGNRDIIEQPVAVEATALCIQSIGSHTAFRPSLHVRKRISLGDSVQERRL